MKPGTILTQHNSPEAARLAVWLKANGCRHFVPAGVRIIFTGNRLIVPTFDIERIDQKNTKWAHRKGYNGKAYLPIKTRTYRVRVPFEAIPQPDKDQS